MRFTIINAKKKNPSYERNRSMQMFISIAAAEIVMLTLMVVLFVKLRNDVDAPLLISVMIIVAGVLTYFIRKSVLVSHSVMMFCLLALQIIIYVDLPQMTPVGQGEIVVNPTDAIPLVFLIGDIFIVRWLLAHGIEIEGEEDTTQPKPTRVLDFEDRIKR